MGENLFDTRAQSIRVHGGAIMALATAQKADGSVFKYEDILEAVGLPKGRDWQRSLSHYLVDNGVRRRVEYTQKKREIEDGGLLESVEEIPEVKEEEQGLYVRVPVVEIMEATQKIHDACDDFFHLLEKYLTVEEAGVS